MRLRRFGIFSLVFGILVGLAPQASAQAPTISIDSATFTVGRFGSIEITATDADTIDLDGDLPSGVSFVDNGDGTATISGTPAVGEEDDYPLTIIATNEGDPDDPADDETTEREFTLVVLAAPAATATPTPSPTLVPVATTASCQTLNSSQVPDTTFVRGERFFVRGRLPGVTNVTLLFNGLTSIGSDGADAGGRYLVAGQIPLNARLGANTVIARGRAGTATRQATCGINVVSGAVLASRRGATLPRTGLSIPVMFAFAVTVLELGVGLVLVADGRRANPVIGPRIRTFVASMRRRNKPRILG